MRNKMSMLFVLVMVLAGVSASAQRERLIPPKAVGVLMYADWCSFCKVLEPKLDEVKVEFEEQGILFTRFDLTDSASTYQTAYFASAMGLDALFRLNGGATGHMIMVAWPSREVLVQLTSDMSTERIRTALAQLVE